MSFILLKITVPEYWIVAALMTIMILLLVEWFRSTRLSDNKVITEFVNAIDPELLPTFVPSSNDVREIDQRLQEQQLYFSGITIRQALTIAVSERTPFPSNPKTGIELIDNMSGYQFELYLLEFFQSQGYRAELAWLFGDHCVDLILQKEDRKIAVQCKRYQPSNKVGNEPIQEVATGKLRYECTEAWVITTSFYTSHAMQLANELEVRLIDRSNLIKLLNG
ncbi:restriction endonuclease [Sporosarcina sp. ACRSL]|uniref:restriction endonuclease n=1 Tax=Sporosarcina sp. ACRSL TaxID=2918215 RepID=UPI001EF50DCD|nr:restriction endonuclease [Sporosarcina sp. ACRSL]MCG7344805.1 restriction endonuclease [Sporosarcina sp. ACRSL]